MVRGCGGINCGASGSSHDEYSQSELLALVFCLQPRPAADIFGFATINDGVVEVVRGISGRPLNEPRFGVEARGGGAADGVVRCRGGGSETGRIFICGGGGDINCDCDGDFPYLEVGQKKGAKFGGGRMKTP